VGGAWFDKSWVGVDLHSRAMCNKWMGRDELDEKATVRRIPAEVFKEASELRNEMSDEGILQFVMDQPVIFMWGPGDRSDVGKVIGITNVTYTIDCNGENYTVNKTHPALLPMIAGSWYTGELRDIFQGVSLPPKTANFSCDTTGAWARVRSMAPRAPGPSSLAFSGAWSLDGLAGGSFGYLG